MSSPTVQRALPPGAPGCHIHMSDYLFDDEPELSAEYNPARPSTLGDGTVPESVQLTLGSMRVVLSPEVWEHAISAVQEVIREGRKQVVAQQVQADMAASPIVANSPVLASYLACEGIEVER